MEINMKNKAFGILKWALFAVLIVHIVLPLLTLFGHISLGDAEKFLFSAQFGSMLWNSVLSATVAMLVSVGIALILAWCINRTAIKHKNVLTVLFTLPMLVPSISHGMGLTLLFGDNGFFTNLTGINIHLFGMTGIVIGATLYSFPMAFLMLTDIFRYEDFTVYEVAEVLGFSKAKQFFKITLPNLKKTLISTAFAVFTMVFTDYGVPLTVGGTMTTLPVYMYREVIGLLDYSKGGIIGVILLIPAVIAFLVDILSKESGAASTVTRPYQVGESRVRDAAAQIICLLVLILISLPILTFVVLSFVKQYPVDLSFTLENIKEAFELGIGRYLLNSLFIALTAALLGTLAAYYAAFVTSRTAKPLSSMALHLISIISLSIPGIVLGLSYVLFFKGSFIYGTFAILISVNIIHFFSSPYLMAYNALLKFNNNLEDVAQSLGISKLRMLVDVYMPSTQETVLEMFSYIFVNSMVTISAVSFLANFKNMPLALLIPQFDSQSLIEAVSFISVIILIVNVAMKLIVHFLKRRFAAE